LREAGFDVGNGGGVETNTELFKNKENNKKVNNNPISE